MPADAGKAIILDDPNKGVLFTKTKNRRKALKAHLHSNTWQWTIISFVILDALLVHCHPLCT